MNEEIKAYEEYLLNFGMVEKPQMPKFDLQAYTENEYTSAIFELLKDFDKIDDEYLIVERFKGDRCK